MKEVVLISLFALLSTFSFSQSLYFSTVTTNTGAGFSMNSQSGIHLGDSFETILIQSDGKYKAERVEEKTETKNVVVKVVDDKYKQLLFDTPDEFISYMSERGYELVERNDDESRIDCKFMKKGLVVKDCSNDTIQD